VYPVSLFYLDLLNFKCLCTNKISPHAWKNSMEQNPIQDESRLDSKSISTESNRRFASFGEGIKADLKTLVLVLCVR